VRRRLSRLLGRFGWYPSGCAVWQLGVVLNCAEPADGSRVLGVVLHYGRYALHVYAVLREATNDEG